MRCFILVSIFLAIPFTELIAQSGSFTTQESLLQIVREYRTKGSFFIDKKLRDVYLDPSATHRNDFERLKVISSILASQPVSHEMVLKLLEEYQDHDGVPRQLLCTAILKAGGFYTQTDLPYLKQVFLVSIPFKDTDSFKHDLSTSPEMFRLYLAVRINIILGVSDPIENAEGNLSRSDPKAWINKKLPVNNTTPCP